MKAFHIFKTRLTFFVFILVVYSQNGLFAQSKALDSLFSLLDRTPEIAIQTDILTQIAYEYLKSSPDSSLQIIGRAEKLMEQLNDPKREALLLNRKGLAFFDKGNLTLALKYINNSLALSEKIRDRNLIGRNLGNLALIYLGVDNYLLAMVYLKKSMVIFEELHNDERLVITLNNIGSTYIDLNKLDSASYFLEKALPLTRKHAPAFLSFAMYNDGEIKFKKKQYKEALQDAYQALTFARYYSDQPDLVVAHLLLARIHFAEGRLDAAIIETQNAIKIAEKTKRKRDRFVSYELYSRLLEAKKDFKNALYYNELSVIYRDSVQSETINNALQLFEYEKKQTEISRLKAEKVQSESEYEQKLYEQQTLIFYTILVLVFSLLLTTFILISLERVKRINKNLSLAMREIQEKQEEILAQNEEIRMQQHEINHLNQHLEDLVKEKTNALFHRNAQLNEYAHFNAHELRSPIATILGLYEVLKLTESADEKELIIEKIQISIIQLDVIVRKSQEILNDLDEL